MAMIPDPYSLKWGQLVKSWATGRDYIGTSSASQPPAAGVSTAGKTWALPALSPVNFSATVAGVAVQKTIPGVLYLSTSQFSTLVNAAGIPTVNYPPGTDEVIIVQGNASTMVLRLPPTSVLQASEQNLLNGGPYPTPSFYEPLFSPPGGGAVVHAHPPAMPDRAGVMDLHANRIGDYTMGLCA
jgi:hypothetical protein